MQFLVPYVFQAVKVSVWCGSKCYNPGLESVFWGPSDERPLKTLHLGPCVDGSVAVIRTWMSHDSCRTAIHHLLALNMLKCTHNVIEIMPRTFVGNFINTRVFQELLSSQIDDCQMKNSTLKPCWNTSIPTTRAVCSLVGSESTEKDSW